MKWFSRGFAVVSLFLIGLMVVPGCTQKPADKGKDSSQGKDKDKDKDKGKGGHAHADEGPHGGALAEWGDEKYHAEFTVDHEKKQATVYILDGSAKKASPIAVETIQLSITNVKPPVQITLKADAEKDDPKGSSSRFVGTHEKLGVEMEFKGEISAKIGDTPYSGTFEEKPHKDHKDDKKKK
jgi:hypothetical protein